MRSIAALLALAVGALTPSAHAAKPLIDLGAIADSHLYASANEGANRVGRAVMVRLALLTADGHGYAPLVLVACDGSWVTSSLQISFEVSETTTAAGLLSKAKRDDVPVPLDSVSFQPIADTQLYYAKPLAKRAAELCKGSAKEPRNVLLPVVDSTQGNDNGTSFAVVLGTSTRTGQTIDVWFRSSSYRLETITLEDGSPWVIDGKVQQRKVATGKYDLERAAVNCSERSMATLEYVEYSGKGGTPETISVPRSKLSFRAGIPDSVGEAQLDTVCMLYGGK